LADDSSEGRPELVGGHVAVDLVNTVGWRLDSSRRVDRLVDLAALLNWAQRVDLVTESSAADIAADASADPDAAQRVVEAVRMLREHLYGTLVATERGPGAEHFVAIQKALISALRKATPDANLPLRWTIVPRRPDDLQHLLTLHAVDLLRSEEVTRIRQCDGGGCGWLFIDNTRNHSRRWCDAGDCGNRERVRRHYARRKP
jgi:predicted RNA-binding Zn ribbon-like protein